MATIEKYVNSGQNGNDKHTGDDPVNQPWKTIQHGVDWFRDHRQPGDTGILNVVGAFQENVSMVGQKYSNITIQSDPLPAGSYDPSILTQYCEARPQIGGDPATGVHLSGAVFNIERADGVVLRNLTILLAECGVDANHCRALTLDNCCIHDHLTQTPGAGFRLDECNGFKMNQCRVWSNKATKTTGAGGGGFLYNCKGAAIEGSLFYLNEADQQGGALYIDNCGNPSAPLSGASGAGVSIAGCTIGAPFDPLTSLLSHIGPNRAHNGGGVAIRDSQVVFKTGIGPLATSGNVPTRIASNGAEENGGGIFIERDEDDCSVELQKKTEVLGNTAAIQGGGIAVHGGDNAGNLPSLKIDHSLLDGNVADDGTGTIGDGGGIWGTSLRCTIEETTISGNRAAEDGGGIYIGEGKDDGTFLKISRHCVLQGNRADKFGGGIYGFCPINIKDSKFLDNTADGGSGAINFSSYTLEVDTVEFTHNTGGLGGGIGSLWSITKVHACSFTRNESSDAGGGLSVMWSDGTIDSNKFVGNHAGEGAAIDLYSCDLTQVQVTSNEFDGNTDVKGPGSGADIRTLHCWSVNQATLIANNTFTGPPDVVVTP